MLIFCLYFKLARVTGGYGGGNRDEILELKDGDIWWKVGTMKSRRYHHAISVVDYNDYEPSCK